jgi:hypothetical protein
MRPLLALSILILSAAPALANCHGQQARRTVIGAPVVVAAPVVVDAPARQFAQRQVVTPGTTYRVPQPDLVYRTAATVSTVTEEVSPCANQQLAAPCGSGRSGVLAAAVSRRHERVGNRKIKQGNRRLSLAGTGVAATSFSDAQFVTANQSFASSQGFVNQPQGQQYATPRYDAQQAVGGNSTIGVQVDIDGNPVFNQRAPFNGQQPQQQAPPNFQPPNPVPPGPAPPSGL